MHAHVDVSFDTPVAQAQLSGILPFAGTQPLSQIRTGQHFVRGDSPTEVLVLLSFAAVDVHDPDYCWAVIIAINPGSPGFIPGQLVRLAASTRVKRVHEAREPVFALEQ